MNAPENPWLSYTAVIEEVRSEIESVTTLTLRLQDEGRAAQYRFAPGQFNMLYVPGCGEVAISMSGPVSDDGNRIVHTIRNVGRSPDLLLYARELDAWRSSGIEIHLTVDRADPHWHGHVGVVPLLIDRLVDFAPSNTRMFLCGPEIMMHFSAKSALARGMAQEHVWLSMERNMQCAFGMCGHCQWGAHFVCRNGPVLRYDVAEPFLQVRDL